jgi:hypothetical protein
MKPQSFMSKTKSYRIGGNLCVNPSYSGITTQKKRLQKNPAARHSQLCPEKQLREKPKKINSKCSAFFAFEIEKAA